MPRIRIRYRILKLRALSWSKTQLRARAGRLERSER
jgi:hypothetical protein